MIRRRSDATPHAFLEILNVLFQVVVLDFRVEKRRGETKDARTLLDGNLVVHLQNSSEVGQKIHTFSEIKPEVHNGPSGSASEMTAAPFS